MTRYKLSLLMALFVFVAMPSVPKLIAQTGNMSFNLDKEGSKYARITFLNQVWIRYNQNNPGSTVDGYPEDNTFDIGLRRTRIQVYGKLSDQVFFYTQYGLNNFSYHGARKQGLFFHDAVVELHPVANKLAIGSGLTGWSGLSRYASPSIGSILSMDAPLYQQATNDVTDQFVRKLSLYAKGKLGKFDYRLALSKPLALSQSTAQSKNLSTISLFSSLPSKPQFQGYFMYQFLDQEANTTPYNTGSYLGKKDVFNLGFGFITQRDAMWRGIDSDTLHSNLELFAFDVFYDHPLNKETGTAITAYGSVSFNNYGLNYTRNVGVMNPVNGTTNNSILNGSGDGFPMLGSGTTVYLQAGYLLPKDLLKSWGTLQPYAAVQYSDLERLADPMLMYETGFNWLISGHQSKLSFNYQSRPIFEQNNSGDWVQTQRKGMLVLQWQVSI